MSRRPFKPPMSNTWFMQKPFYRAYMIRESTSIFIGLWTINLLIGLLSLSQGEQAWQAWLDWQRHPLMIGFSLSVFLMAMYHTTTWFATVPKTLPPLIAGKKVPAKLVVLAHWMGFVIASLIILVALTWGIRL